MRLAKLLLILLLLLQIAFCCTVKGCHVCRHGTGGTKCRKCKNNYDRKDESCCDQDLDNCKSCFINQKKCDSCQTDSYALHNGNCKQKCEKYMNECQRCTSSTVCIQCLDRTHTINQSNRCQPCSQFMSNCRTCSSMTVCLKCNSSYTINSTNLCQLCSQLIPGCNTCSSAMNCTNCLLGSVLSNGSCPTCSQVISNCLTCTNSATCTTCALGFIRNSTNKCPSCSQVIPNCETCNSTTVCLICQPGSILNSTNKCPTCSQAIYQCATCNSTTCLSCLPNSFFNTSSQCQLCSELIPQCQNCSSNTTCIQCVSNYTLNSSSRCQLCSELMFQCNTCSSDTTCLTCFANFTINSTAGCSSCGDVYLYCIACNSNSCSQCSTNYTINSSGLCQACSELISNCITCSSNSSCTLCSENYTLNSASECKSCAQMMPRCLSCTNATFCTLCEPNSGYILNSSNTCQKCSDAMANCLNCGSPTTCTQCNTTFVLNSSNLCSTCSEAIANCSECSNNSTCIQCMAGFFLQSPLNCSKCSDMFSFCQECNTTSCLKCSTNYTVNSSGLCQLCSSLIPSCITCNSTTECNLCIDNFMLDSSLACQHCTVMIPYCSSCNSTNSSSGCNLCQNDSFYLDSTSRSCKFCSQNIYQCLRCSSHLICLECNTNNQSIILSSVSNTCRPCFDLMAYCVQCSNEYTCLRCTQTAALMLSLGNMCALCSQMMYSCHKCTSQYVCTSCLIGRPVRNGCSSTRGCIQTVHTPLYQSCLYCDPTFYQSSPVNGTCTCRVGHLAGDFCTTIAGCVIAVNDTVNNTGIFCLACNKNNNFIPVNNTCVCQPHYQLSGQTCVQICGDGYLIGRGCDDGNLQNGDGCSSACQVQEDYQCRKNANNTSICAIAVRVELQLVCIYKLGGQNSLKITFTTNPQVKNLYRSNFNNAIQFSLEAQHNITKYVFQGPYIHLYIDYFQDVQGHNAALDIIFDTNYVLNPPTYVLFQLYDCYGVPLHFSQQQPSYMMLLRTIIFGLSVGALVVLVIGSWAHRMIGVQTIHTLQIVRCLQLFSTAYYPVLYNFENLNISLGMYDLFWKDASTDQIVSYLKLDMNKNFSGNFQVILIYQVLAAFLYVLFLVIKKIVAFLKTKKQSIKNKLKNLISFTFDSVVFPAFFGFAYTLVISLQIQSDRSIQKSSTYMTQSALVLFVTMGTAMASFSYLSYLFKETSQAKRQSKVLGCNVRYFGYYIIYSLLLAIFFELGVLKVLPESAITFNVFIVCNCLILLYLRPYQSRVHNFGLLLNQTTIFFAAAWILIPNFVTFSSSIDRILAMVQTGLLAAVLFWALIRIIYQFIFCSSRIVKERNMQKSNKKNNKNKNQEILKQIQLIQRQIQEAMHNISPYHLQARNMRERQRDLAYINRKRKQNSQPLLSRSQIHQQKRQMLQQQSLQKRPQHKELSRMINQQEKNLRQMLQDKSPLKQNKKSLGLIKQKK